jgi:hypothetical protein
LCPLFGLRNDVSAPHPDIVKELMTLGEKAREGLGHRSLSVSPELSDGDAP